MKFLSRVFDESLASNETYYNNDFTWIMEGKLEYNISLTDENKIINLAPLDRIKLIIIEVDNPVDIVISNGINTLSIEVDELFAFTPTVDMVNSITEFSITESSYNVANVKIRIYGESLES